MNKRVLVVGGSYFIGRSIVDELLRRGYDVYVLNRGSVPLWDRRIKQIVCDRDNGSVLKEALYQREFEIIIDVSGLNSKQAERLCEALNRDVIETFVFMSSSAVYDVKTLEIPYKENDSMAENPYWWDYGSDKIKAEFYYTGQFVWTKTKLIILRPPYVYGENNYAQRESFIFEHVDSGKPVIIPVSNPRLQFIYASDLADFTLEAIENVKENINIFNVGNSKSMTAREWVESCAKAAGGKVDIIEYDYVATGRNARDFFPFYDYNNVLDVSKMKSVYTQETDFIEGLKNSYAWYKANKENIKFKPNVAFSEKQILEELQAKKEKEKADKIIRTAKNDDSEVAEWFAGQMEANRSRRSEEAKNAAKRPKNLIYVSKEKSMMNAVDIYKLFVNASMAAGRSAGEIAKTMDGSECYALYDEGVLAGFARVVTDKVTVGVLCDFVVGAKNNIKDYDNILMNYIKSDSVLSGVNVITAVDGDKAFLKKSGFSKATGYMERFF